MSKCATPVNLSFESEEARDALAAPFIAVSGDSNSLSLWEILGIPPPENATSQHTSRRILIIGRPFSGKRTLCQRLRYAAESQYPQSGEAANLADPFADKEDDEKKELYLPKEGEQDDFQEDWKYTANTTKNAVGDSYHGIGMSHEFVVQRVPSSVNAVKGFAPEVTLRGVRRITEFFCCDAAGSLTSALPDLESLGQAVALIVVDCSEPASIQDQVKEAYAQLRGHITSVFKRQLQQKDKVRYMQAVEDRLSFRRASEPAMAQLRDAIFPDQKLDKPVELPSEDVCVLPSVLVATKTDILEKLVKSYETIEDSLQNDVALDSIIPSEFRSLARRKKESVTSVVSQYLRYQALLHCSSFASSSSRVNTVAGGGDGKTPLVHPFYRGFWIFLANSVLDDSARKQKRLTDAVTNVSGCQFFPSSLVPLGVDNASFLDPFISSGGISIPTRSAGDVDPSVSQSLPDGLTVTELPVQGLHQTYLRKLQEEEELGGSVPIISTSLPTSPTGAKGDDAKMIWDTA